MIKFNDPVNLRQIILCSTLSERPIQIENFHTFEQPQGLRAYEVKFLRLIERISNGVKIEINKTGTYLKFYPGIITNNGGEHFDFECGPDRAISYYLEYLLLFALFGKARLQCTLKGFTNDNYDQSVDSLINVAIPLLKNNFFGLNQEDQNIILKINKRGFRPEPTGEVYFSCPFVRFLRACNLTKKGQIKRVRGVCCAQRVSPQLPTSVISAARDVLGQFVQDVWIHTDLSQKNKGKQQQQQQQQNNNNKNEANSNNNVDQASSGYSICLVAETTNGAFFSVDECFDPEFRNGSNNNNIEAKNMNKPDKIGERAALRLLDEVMHCGFVDSNQQTLALNLIALSEKKLSYLALGRITPFTVDNLRILREFFGVVYKIKENELQALEDDDDNKQEEKKENQSDAIEMEEQDQKKQVQEEDQSEQSQQNDIENSVQTLSIFYALGTGLNNLSRATY